MCSSQQSILQTDRLLEHQLLTYYVWQCGRSLAVMHTISLVWSLGSEYQIHIDSYGTELLVNSNVDDIVFITLKLRDIILMIPGHLPLDWCYINIRNFVCYYEISSVHKIENVNTGIRANFIKFCHRVTHLFRVWQCPIFRILEYIVDCLIVVSV